MLTPPARSINLRDAAVDARGAIVAVGNEVVDDALVFALMRVDATGVLDATFGTGGVVTTRIGELAEAYAVAIAPDGGILTGGLSVDRQPFVTLARYGGGTH